MTSLKVTNILRLSTCVSKLLFKSKLLSSVFSIRIHESDYLTQHYEF